MNRKLWQWYIGKGGRFLAIVAIFYIVYSFIGDVTGWLWFEYINNNIAQNVAVLVLVTYFGLTTWSAQNRLQDIVDANEKTKPIIRVIDYGNEDKTIYTTLEDGHGNSRARYSTEYDTLFLVVSNFQKYGDAKKIWSKIDWMNKRGKTLKSHQGRWHIATPNKELKKESLQYIDLDSNGHPEKLHFASKNKGRDEEAFYGLCREMDGGESWDNKDYKLDEKEYIVKITLSGSNNVSQEFKYVVKNSKGKIQISKALTDESEKIGEKPAKKRKS